MTATGPTSWPPSGRGAFPTNRSTRVAWVWQARVRASSLAPGERRAATFALPWDFPLVQFRDPVDGTIWRKRYTQWYPGSYQGWAMARDLLDDASMLERGIDSWWSVVAKDTDYPLWLRTAVLNELYYDVFGGVFWENGCVSKPKRFGDRPGQHLYFTVETDVFRDCESMDVRHYEARHLLELFPSIERDVLLGWADMVNADSLGRTPHDAGSPVDDPWFVVGQYSGTRPGKLRCASTGPTSPPNSCSRPMPIGPTPVTTPSGRRSIPLRAGPCCT